MNLNVVPDCSTFDIQAKDAKWVPRAAPLLVPRLGHCAVAGPDGLSSHQNEL